VFVENFTFFISNSRRALNVICYLLGNSPASEFYIPTFRKTLFHLHRRVDGPMNMEYTEYSETSSYKIQTPENYPEGSIQYPEFYIPTFRNTLFHLHRRVDGPMNMEHTDYSETSSYKIQTPENYPEGSIKISRILYSDVSEHSVPSSQTRLRVYEDVTDRVFRNVVIQNSGSIKQAFNY
jgi:hypothetical protein